MRRVIRNAELCYGCRACQLACSFHHTGGFWPERSSIQVSRNPQTGAVKWVMASTCDGCRTNDEEPLCVKYCSYQALRMNDQNPPESTR